MKDLGLQSIPLAQIDASDRLREVDEAYAQLLAENIDQAGRLRQPIELRRMKGGEAYKLIAGGHRLRAVTILEWSEVPAFVFDATDDEARLAEIDENLVRHDLNPLDRAVFLAERKAVYERLYPETKAGTAGAEAKHGRANDILSFAASTAERIGLTERTIQRAVMVATKIAPELRARIAGTWLAKKQNELLALAKLPPEEQAAVIDLLLGDEPKAKGVGDAARQVRGGREVEASGTDKQFKALLNKWGRTSEPAQRQFLQHLQETGELRKLLGESTQDAKEAA